MVSALLGRKVGMSQVYDENGQLVPVTIIQAGPCYVTQIKSVETDGYEAVQIGFDERKTKRTTQPLLGHFAKAGVRPKRLLREVKAEPGADLSPGQELDVTVFEGVELVDVIGTSIGRGFQGVVKRHGFSGGPASHGSKTGNLPGSIGCSASPSRVLKGRKLPGHMGDRRVTIRNLRVVRIDKERNLVLLRGAVPGAVNGLVMVRQAGKGKTEN